MWKRSTTKKRNRSGQLRMDRKRILVTAALASILILAIGVRLSGAILNRDAYDNHVKVIRIIATEQRIPSKEEPECLQCYHPKLYHATAGTIARFLPAQDDKTLYIVGQLMSALAGIGTVVYILLFLGGLRLTPLTQITVFLLTALNPALIGINIQSTNDSFVILFSTAALYHLYRYLQNVRYHNLIILTASVILAALSKGSGLIIWLGTLLVLSGRLIAVALSGAAWKRLAFDLIVFTILTLTLIAFFGPYGQHWVRYGSPLVINKEISPAPHFFEKTYVGSKTGIVSVYDAYFTFRPLNLIQEPYLNRESRKGTYQPARESLWTQLYARLAFIQYEGRPTRWFVEPDHPIYHIGKIIYVLALLPLTLLLIGIVSASRTCFTGILRERLTYLKNKSDWIFLSFFTAFIAFIIKFTFEYREFSSMKPIYLFPVFLAGVYLFARGTTVVAEQLSSPFARFTLFGILWVLALLGVIDSIVLIQGF